MIDPIAAWKPSGRVCVWRYKPMPRLYAGWHFAADEPGCRSMAALLATLAEAGEAGHRTFALADPRTVAVDRIFGTHELDVKPLGKLKLSFDPAYLEPRPAADADGTRMILTLGPVSLGDMLSFVLEVGAGGGDFGMGLRRGPEAKMNTMQFWWWPKS